MLVQPYRDGGPPIDGWDIAGLGIGVNVRGTINRPGDQDDGWTIEFALPWRALGEAAPGQRAPAAGDHWRVNFSRVEWQVDVADGRYRNAESATGKLLRGRQLGLEPAGRDRDAHARALGRRAVLGSGTRRTGGARSRDPDDLLKWALRRLVPPAAALSHGAWKIRDPARGSRRGEPSRRRPAHLAADRDDHVVVRDQRGEPRRRPRAHTAGRPRLGDRR